MVRKKSKSKSKNISVRPKSVASHYKKTVIKTRPKKRTKKIISLHKCIPKTEILLLTLLSLVVTTGWYVVHSVSEAQRINNQAVKSADSMLAYDRDDIKTAGLVGTVKQLKSEIVGFNKAPNDLRAHMLKDYKEYKKECVINGKLAGIVSYELVEITYNKFALISQGCNGQEQRILKKFGSKWSALYTSGVMVPCSLVNDFDIPQDISYNCQTNGTVYVNPNP